MLDLSDRLGRFGDIAAKELAGLFPDTSDCALVEAPLGSIEARWMAYQLLAAQGEDEPPAMPPVASSSSLVRTTERVLQAGLGPVNRIYVLVPIDGDVAIAQGGVFSYYELILPEEDELNEDNWRLAISADVFSPPPWAENSILAGGSPVDVLAFRPGDVYRLTLAAGQLGLRATPSSSARYEHRLQVGDYIIIVEGPTQAGGATWWKFKQINEGGETVEGWSDAKEEWFERGLGQ